jgi:hypothetical protein
MGETASPEAPATTPISAANRAPTVVGCGRFGARFVLLPARIFAGTACIDVSKLARHRKLDMSRFENLLMKEKIAYFSRGDHENSNVGFSLVLQLFLAAVLLFVWLFSVFAIVSG